MNVQVSFGCTSRFCCLLPVVGCDEVDFGFFLSSPGVVSMANDWHGKSKLR